MKNLDKLAKIKEQIAKLKGQTPSVAEKVRNAKASLPKIADPVAKAKQALEAALSGAGVADAAQQEFAAIQQEIEQLQNGFPDISKAVGSATDLLAQGEQGIQDVLKAKGAELQQQLMAKLQGSMPSASDLLNGAKAKADEVKDRLEKSKAALAKLEQAAGPTADALRKQGTVGKLKSSVDALFGQVPGISDLVGQTLQKLPGIQNPIAQAAGLLQSGVGKTDPKDVAAKLAKVQEQATAIGQHLSGVSGLISKGAAAVPAVKQRMDQVQQLLGKATVPASLADLTKLVDEAIGASGGSGEITAAADKFADFTKLADEGSSILEALAGEDLLPDVKDKVGQVRKALDQARQQLPNAASLVGDIAKRSGDISGQVNKAKNLIGSVLKSAGGPELEKITKIQEQVQGLQEKFSGITKGFSAAGRQLPEIEKKFGKAAELMGLLQPGAKGDTGAALKQFQDLMGELSQSDAIGAITGGASIGDIEGQLKSAQAALSDVLKGGIPESAKGAISQLEKLLGDAGAQFPDLSKVISQAGGGVGNIAKQIENAKKMASSFTPDFVRQLGQSAEVKGFLDKAMGQFPGASQAVAQLTQSLPQVQQSIGKAQQLFSDITSGKVNAGNALEQLAKAPEVQQFLQQAQQFSGVSRLIADAGQRLPQLQGHMTQASQLMNSLQTGDFSPAEIGQALSDMKSSVASAAKSELSKHLTGALGPAGDLVQSLPALQSALSRIQSGQVPAEAQQLLSELQKSLGDSGKQITAISSTISQAASGFSGFAAALQSAQSGSGGLTAAFADQLAQSAQVKNLLERAKQQFPEAAALVSQAAAALPQLQQKFADGQKLLSDAASGNVKPEDLMKQLSASPEFQGILKQAQDQFPEAARLMAQANEMLPQLQQGFETAKSVAADLQKGDLTAVAGTLAASPQVQALLGEAAKQFPEAAAALKKAQEVAAQAQEGFNQANTAMADFQAGNYQAALGQVAAIPAVKNLLAEAQKQFPEAAALMSQAAAALPQIQEGLQQANQAMTALQEGDYTAALQQLQAMPAVQNLLSEAQNMFPEAAALAEEAQQRFAQVEEGLAQADQLITAFQNGDTNAALAQLQDLPAVQSALAAAQQQFPEAAAALSQASALLPEVQAHLDEAQALMDAAVAEDLEELPAVAAAVAETQAAVASAESSEESSETAAPAAGETTSAVLVEEAPAEAPEAEEGAEGDVLLTISTPLGDDKFDVVNIRGEENMSGLFYYRVELTSQDEAVDFTQMVGQGVTVYLELGGDEYRNIHGIVTRMTQLGTDGDDNTTYIAELRPWLWKLTKEADCRIYQAKTVVEIITGLFDELGFTDYENSTTGTYTARDYCVQYRETAFNFLSRLMEEEGIFYFFKHEDGKHTLVLADDSDGYVECTVPEIEYNPTEDAFEDEIFKSSLEQEITTGKYATDDFHFETSETDLLVTADGEGMRWYEYPGGFTTNDAGTAIANKRLAAIEAAGKVFRGASTVKTLVAGCKFTLTQHLRESMNIAYVVRKVSMKCDQQKYTDTFEAIPADVVFRPPLVTPKPIIHGAQTAIVVGKSGEEIWTDKYGRVKVQFHWDQKGVKDENSSCWVRVAQGWAGKAWGMLFLPRIGHEVVVSFLEGNPDRPLITGSVYNAQNTVPYTLPDDQTKSTIKSMSSKQGTAGNEIRFQDLKDSEEFYLHAQKDMKSLIEHDEINHVKNSQQTFVQTDDPAVETDFKHVLIVNGKSKITIKGDANEEAHTNEGKFTHTVTKEYTLTVDGDTLTITAAGDLVVKGKTVTLESTTGDVTIKSAANLKAEAAQALTNKGGTTLTNEAGTSLTNKSGTDLKNEAGTSLTNKASLSLTNDGGIQLTNKASATQECDGGGMLTLKGGMVKLN